MIRHCHLFFIGFFALMQVISPLAHAHFGEVQATGFVHIPWFEVISKGQVSLAQSSDSEELSDVIVTPSKGHKSAHLAFNFSFTNKEYLDFLLLPFLQGVNFNHSYELFLKRFFSFASQRAPPASSI